MKKLNEEGIYEILSDKEMKNVVGKSGGTGSGTCGYRGWFFKGVGGVQDPNNPLIWYAVLEEIWEYESACNVDLLTVLSKQYDDPEPKDFWWCCDSCATSTYCGNG